MTVLDADTDIEQVGRIVAPGATKAALAAAAIVEPTSGVVELLHNAVGSGLLTEPQWEALVIWMTRHMGEDGSADYELLGGATTQRWISRVLQIQAEEDRALAALEAEELEDERIHYELDLMGVDYDPAEDIDVLGSAIEYVNQRDYAAYIRVWSVLEMATKNAMRRTTMKALSSIRNDDVKAAMAAAYEGGGHSIDAIPETVWASAKIDKSVRHAIDSTVDEAMLEVEMILEEEGRLLPKLSVVLGANFNEGQAYQARADAMSFLRPKLTECMHNWCQPHEGKRRTVVPLTMVRHLMAVAGGADQMEPLRDGFPVRRGNRVVAGFGMLNGPLFFEAIDTVNDRGARTAAITIPPKLLDVKYQWRHAHYREPITPFGPHKKLNGRVFLLKNWEKLKSRQKDVNSFPKTDRVSGEEMDKYRVGDHEYCTCAVVPVSFGRGRRILGPDWFDNAIAAANMAGETMQTRAAAFNVNQPRCPVGTGRTAGRFSNDELTNCNPLVTQLNDRALAGRIESIQDELDQGEVSATRAERLATEIDVARKEQERRSEGGTPDDSTSADGVADDPAENTQGDPDFSPIEADELDNLANETGGFTVRDGHDSPTSGYAVAYADAELIIENWTELSEAEQEAIIDQYLADHEQDLINDPRAFVGAWIDDGTMYLDVSEVVNDKEEAARIGLQRNQLGIFAFDTFDTLVPTDVLKEEFNYGDQQVEAVLQAAARRDAAGDGEADGRIDPADNPIDLAALATDPGDEGLRTVSPRNPTNKGDDYEARNLANSMDPNYLLDPSDPVVAAQLRKVWESNAWNVPGLQGMPYEQGLEFFRDNLVNVYERGLERYAGKPLAEMSEGELASAIEQITVDGQWYPGAHTYARDLAETYAIEPEVSAFAIAALSPTSDWDANVANANRTMRALVEDYAITETDAMLVNAELGRDAVVAGQRLSEMTTEEAGRAIGSMFRGDTAEGKGRPDDVGSRYQDEFAEVSTMIMNPDGTYEFEPAFNNDGVSRTMAASKSSLEFERITDVFRTSTENPDGLMEAISNGLGGGHKVRTFYNNIADPFDRSNPSATIDSHSFSSAMGYGFGSGTTVTRPGATKLNRKGEEVPDSKNFYKELGQNGNSNLGIQSSYGTVQHAMNLARDTIADKYGVQYKTSELQSMTWVEHRLGWDSNSPARDGEEHEQIIGLMYEYEASGHDPSVKTRVLSQIETIRADAEAAVLERRRLQEEEARLRQTRTASAEEYTGMIDSNGSGQ